MRMEEPEEQERRKSGKWHVATRLGKTSGLSTTYTLLHETTMPFADLDCCTRTYVYILPESFTSKPVNYTAVLKREKSH